MGIQTIRITASLTRYRPDAEFFCSWSSQHTSPSAITTWYHCRSFKRRAAPSSISSKARSWQDTRPPKRLRRSSRETTERPGSGNLDSNSVHSGPVPKLQRQSSRSYRHAESSNNERATTVGSSGGKWTRTNIHAKGHESIVLWYGSEVLIDVLHFANRYMWIRLRLANLLHHSRVSFQKRTFDSWHGTYWKVLDSVRSIVHSPQHVQNRMIPVIYCFLDILAIGFNRFDIIKTTLSLRRHGHDGIVFLLLHSCLSSCCLILFSCFSSLHLHRWCAV